MTSKLPHHVAFADFCTHATIRRLQNHGRVASVYYNGIDLGFVDSMGERGLRQAHKREVNNALYWHSESEIVHDDMPKPTLPTAAADAEYPDLVERFAIAASILGFYAERNCCGMLVANFCFPSEEELGTLRHALDAYGYLVDRNERVSLLELAERISQRHDQTEPRNRLVIETLRSGAGLSRYASH